MRKLWSVLLAAVLLLTSTATAFAADGKVSADVEPVPSYSVEVGTTYRLPDEVKQAGDTYQTSDANILTVDRETGNFTPVANGMAYIIATQGTKTRHIQVIVGTAQSSGKTLEERINGLTLTPQPGPKEGQPPATWYDFSRVEQIRDDNTLTNYQKMKAVFVDIAQQTKGFSCTSHASLLGAAYEMLGFQVYGAHGGVKAREGYSLEERTGGRMGFGRPGYTNHAWIAVEIDGTPVTATKTGTGTSNDGTWEFTYTTLVTGGEEISLSDDIKLNGEILFFDVNLYSTHGMGFDSCFAVPPQNTTWYYPIAINNYF